MRVQLRLQYVMEVLCEYQDFLILVDMMNGRLRKYER